MTMHIDAPRVICAAPDCQTECLCDPRRARDLLAAGWRCGWHAPSPAVQEVPC